MMDLETTKAPPAEAPVGGARPSLFAKCPLYWARLREGCKHLKARVVAAWRAFRKGEGMGGGLDVRP
jgi:hypothetical protein